MRTSAYFSSLLAALAMAAFSNMPSGTFAAGAGRRSTSNPVAYRGTGRRSRPGWPGLGWSVAEDRRRAKKRRNQLRHRKACKGR